MAKTKLTNPVGRPKRQDKDNTLASSSEKGTIPGDKRKTYIVNSESAAKIEAIAYWDRRSIKEVVNDAFSKYINEWERKNGKVKPMPQ